MCYNFMAKRYPDSESQANIIVENRLPLNINKCKVKGMLYPPGNSELMCHKLPTIPREIFLKIWLEFCTNNYF